MILDKKPKICVIIPSYNAENSILEVIKSIPSYIDCIYIINDGSSDNTKCVIEKENKNVKFKLISHNKNMGIGAAMISGYKKALEDGYDICVKMDADGQMSPTYLPELLEPIISQRSDYSKGNRFHHDQELKKMPFVRRIGNLALSFLVKMASGNWAVFDPTNGYTAIHRAALEEINFNRLHKRYFFEISMLVLLRECDAIIEDVSIPAIYGEEKSHLNIKKILIQFPLLLLKYGIGRIKKQYFIYDFNLVSLSLLVGTLLLIFGIGFGIDAWIHNSALNKITPPGTVMIAALPILIGIQFLLQAISMDVANIPKRSLQQKMYRKREKIRKFFDST